MTWTTGEPTTLFKPSKLSCCLVKAPGDLREECAASPKNDWPSRLWKITCFGSTLIHPPDEKLQSVINIGVFVVVIRTDSPLAKLYTTSTLEHHHFNHAVIILSTEVSGSVVILFIHV